MVPLKYLSNLSRTLEIPSLNCKINPDLNWPKKCVIVANNADEATTFLIADTKLYVPVVILSNRDKPILFKQLKSSFKGRINSNKFESKKSTERQNQYLNYLIDLSSQGENRLFVLTFENEAQRLSNKQYYLATAEIKNYNVLIDR